MKTINEALNQLEYPGRGLIIGMSSDGNYLAIAYFIMGRSANSQNRILKFEKNSIQTLSLKNYVHNKNLIIYKPVIKFQNFIVVSNGNQTETIIKNLKMNINFINSMRSRNFENDPPIYTPRIAAIIKLKKINFSYKIAIVKKAQNSKHTERFFFEYMTPTQGQGHLIHTYKGQNNSNIESFSGAPILIKIPKTAPEFQSEIWESLNKKNKISLYTEFINLKTKKCLKKIINKNLKLNLTIKN